MGFTDCSILPNQQNSPQGTELIGGGECFFETSAMRVGPDPGDPSRIVFLAEVPARYYPDRSRNLFIPGVGEMTLQRNEVKIHRVLEPDEEERQECPLATDETLRIGKGGRIIVVDVPRRTFNLFHATLRYPFKGRKDKKPVPSPELASDLSALGGWLDKQAWDYWETSSEYLTASNWSSLQLEPWMAAIWKDGHVRQERSPRFALGFCEDYDHCVEQIRNSDKFRSVVSKTQSGNWPHWPRGVYRKDRSLRDDLKVTADELLLWSVKQAMAGPDDEISSAELCNRPVLDLALRIYNAHLDRMNRRKEKGAVVGGRSATLEPEKHESEPVDAAAPDVDVRVWAARQNLSEDERDVLDELHESCELEHWESKDAIDAWSIALGYLRMDVEASERRLRRKQLEKLLSQWQGDFDSEQARSLVDRAVEGRG